MFRNSPSTIGGGSFVVPAAPAVCADDRLWIPDSGG